MSKVVTFGEIMGRITPEGFLRFQQAIPGKLDLTFGGAESNVAGSLALLGGRAAFVTALPNNALGEACVAFLRSLRVETEGIVRTERGRLGLYFVETGANQRPSNVIYDRENSAVALTPAEAYNWDGIFQNASWFHLTGITPAISSTAAAAALAAVQSAQKHGLTVSCDLNFRKKLWRWDAAVKPRDLAEKTMRTILPYADVVIANEEDAAEVLSIHAGATDVNAGQLAVDQYPAVAKKIISEFGNVAKVAITLRESLSASHNNWGAMLYERDSGQAFFAPSNHGRYEPYQIRNIVDRVGGGDAFAAGLIFALTTKELAEPQTGISFAVAASCLAHSIYGDMNYSSRKEVEALMRGSGSGRVQR